MNRKNIAGLTLITIALVACGKGVDRPRIADEADGIVCSQGESAYRCAIAVWPPGKALTDDNCMFAKGLLACATNKTLAKALAGSIAQMFIEAHPELAASGATVKWGCEDSGRTSIPGKNVNSIDPPFSAEDVSPDWSMACVDVGDDPDTLVVEPKACDVTKEHVDECFDCLRDAAGAECCGALSGCLKELYGCACRIQSDYWGNPGYADQVCGEATTTAIALGGQCARKEACKAQCAGFLATLP